MSEATERPLADRMRPRSLDECVGQEHVIGDGAPLRRALEQGSVHSMVFWGPPGTGKTTLARLIAEHADLAFVSLSAVMAGVKDIRSVVEEAGRRWREDRRGTILFIDEAHRFNKSQQDAFLPYVEDGTVVFVGATTENPSFELNNALLSRVRVYPLSPLDETDLRGVLDRALADSEWGLGARRVTVPDELREMLCRAADGDARRALNLLELSADLAGAGGTVDRATVEQVARGDGARFDKDGDALYEQISALHKSMRGSAPDASLYWLARMLQGGCDPLYLARRIVRMASEDIGNADPRGLRLALDAWEAQERLGSPEGHLALAQAVVYLACAPKSNAVYAAFNAAWDDAAVQGSQPVPVHLRNAPTRLMKELGYGRAYRYAHDEPDAYAAGEQYFPDELTPRRYYHPAPRGLEARIADKLAELKAKDDRANEEGRGAHD